MNDIINLNKMSSFDPTILSLYYYETVEEKIYTVEYTGWNISQAFPSPANLTVKPFFRVMIGTSTFT